MGRWTVAQWLRSARRGNDDNQDLVRVAVLAGATLMVVSAVRLGLAVKAMTIWVEEVMAETKVWLGQQLQCLMLVPVMMIWDGEGFVSNGFGSSGFRVVSGNVERVE